MQDASETVVAVHIAEAAHHLDLMFSHPTDNASLRAARRLEMRHVRRWIRQKSAAHARRPAWPRAASSLSARILECLHGTGGGCGDRSAHAALQA